MYSKVVNLLGLTIWICIFYNNQAEEHTHTVRNLHFLSKNSTMISRENCRLFWGLKTRENVVVLGFTAVDNFDFTRKIVKTILYEKLEKLVKMSGFCQNRIFGQKFDF